GSCDGSAKGSGEVDEGKDGKGSYKRLNHCIHKCVGGSNCHVIAVPSLLHKSIEYWRACLHQDELGECQVKH
uniref:Apple domain-containing protein n=1 Tax=Parascaris univalens TaxID=6257 RepID=A0A915B652_PARUN